MRLLQSVGIFFLGSFLCFLIFMFPSVMFQNEDVLAKGTFYQAVNIISACVSEFRLSGCLFASCVSQNMLISVFIVISSLALDIGTCRIRYSRRQ